MTAQRTTIRRYLTALVQAAVGRSVGDRVFVGRPNPVMFSELPCVLIMPGAETVEAWGGTPYVPTLVLRTIGVPVLICVDQPTSPDQSLEIEDRLDDLEQMIEVALRDDRFFSLQLSGYDPKTQSNDSLLTGSRVTSIDVALDNEAEIGLAMLQLKLELQYYELADNDKRAPQWERWAWELRRVGWDETTVDPILIAAEEEI